MWRRRINRVVLIATVAATAGVYPRYRVNIAGFCKELYVALGPRTTAVLEQYY